MYAICIECSHARGMGHLFRAIVLAKYLKKKCEDVIIFLNKDETAVSVLSRENLKFVALDTSDSAVGWEQKLIQEYDITLWINDRMGTSKESAYNIKSLGVAIAAIDDTGPGAEFADINFVSMTLDENIELRGGKILRGFQYLILNPEIAEYIRKRECSDRIVVSLGGSDTHNVTLNVAEKLRQMNRTATIILGPSFQMSQEIKDEYGDFFEYKESVFSLAKEFYEYDVAITGGGITCLEAAAAGLPVMIAANEPHEVYIAQRLESLGCAIYLGFRNNANRELQLPSNKQCALMSAAGIAAVPHNGIDNVYFELKELESIGWKR